MAELERKMHELKIDPELRDLLPPLSKEEFEQLEKNIIKDGCAVPICTWNDFIMDGHNRYTICSKHKIPFTVYSLNGMLNDKSEVMRRMIDEQLGRRNLSQAQRVAVTEKYRPKFEEKAKESYEQNVGRPTKEKSTANLPTINKVNTRAELSTLANVPERTYDKIKTVLDSGNEEVKDQLLRDEISVDKAYKEVKSSKLKAETKTENKPISVTSLPQSTTKKCLKCGTCMSNCKFNAIIKV